MGTGMYYLAKFWEYYRVVHLVADKLLDNERRVALRYEEDILRRNFYFDVNKLSSATRWTTLYNSCQIVCVFSFRPKLAISASPDLAMSMKVEQPSFL